MNPHVKPGAIDLTEMLFDIEVPSLEVPELDVLPSRSKPDDLFAEKSSTKSLFEEKKRAVWKEVQTEEARCDFAPNRLRITVRGGVYFISLWKKSIYGRTLKEIKADDSMVEFFAQGMNTLIRQILGHSLASGDWCLVTTPKRRHKVRNFATLISARLSQLLDVPFYEDLAQAQSSHRVGAVFTLTGEPPRERNIIIFDDFVTSGSTMLSMKNLLRPLGYNLVFFTGINNKM